MQWLLHWVNQPCNRSPNQSSPKTFFKQKKSSFTFPNNQILKRKHILGPSERTNYLIDPKNEISTKKILILTQNVNFLLSKKTFPILSWEKVSHALPKKKTFQTKLITKMKMIMEIIIRRFFLFCNIFFYTQLAFVFHLLRAF